MIGAPNTQDPEYWVGIVQWAPETSVSEEIADIFRNYNIDTVAAGALAHCEASYWHRIAMKYVFPFLPWQRILTICIFSKWWEITENAYMIACFLKKIQYTKV